jgi:IS1 family transposase
MLQKARFRGQKEKKRYCSQKKKRHTLRTQVVVDKRSTKIICTSFSNGKRRDFRLLKESHIHQEIQVVTDSGYEEIQKIHRNSEVPQKAEREKSTNQGSHEK